MNRQFATFGLWSLLPAICTLAIALAGATGFAAKPKGAKPAETEPPIKEAFVDYREWKPVNAEPIAVPEHRSALCAPRGAVDPNGPHAGGFINVYVNAIGREEYTAGNPPALPPGANNHKEK
jgi:hypothetical protein